MAPSHPRLSLQPNAVHYADEHLTEIIVDILSELPHLVADDYNWRMTLLALRISFWEGYWPLEEDYFVVSKQMCAKQARAISQYLQSANEAGSGAASRINAG